MNDQPPPPGNPLAEELALLSHDIRASLSDILAGLAGIDGAALPPATRQQLHRVRASGEGLARLLTQALTTVLTHADQGQNQAAILRQDQVMIPEVVEDLTSRWSHATDGQLTTIVTAASNLPARMICDRTAIDRVLANLLSNAIAHSGGEPVTLDITHPSPMTLRFAIQDHGPGFPPHLTGSPDASHRDPGAIPLWHSADGHGLGLHIAQNLARQMGASITLENPQTGGGLAVFSLQVALPTEGAAPDTVAQTALHDQHVLVADDSPSQLLMLGQILMDAGAQVTLLRNGAAVRAALQYGRYDLAVFDHDMPGRSGVELCADLRGQPNRPRIAILTGHATPAFRDQALAAGADMVIVKPILSVPDLLAALTQGTAAPHRPDAFLRLLEIAGPDMAAELVARFQVDLANMQCKIKAGLAAQDWPALGAASHVIIGLAGTAGVTPLADTARDFNLAATEQDAAGIALHSAALLQGLADLIAFVDDAADRIPAPP